VSRWPSHIIGAAEAQRLGLNMMLLHAAGLAAEPPTPPPSYDFNHAGTPAGITPSFDCAARKAAYEFGSALLPTRGSFKSLFEALQLKACGMETPADEDKYKPPSYQSPGTETFVAPDGDDSNDGTIAKPLKTIAAATRKLAGKTDAIITLRAGVHYTPETVELGVEHSGLTIQNYAGEEAVVSGAVPLTIPATAWKPYAVGSGKWVVASGQNNVFGRASLTADTGAVKRLGTVETADACQAAATAAGHAGFTYHMEAFGGDFAKHCFGTVSVGFTWAPTPEANVVSGYVDSRNTYVADVSAAALGEVPGLRRNGKRSIRAKFPNGDPTENGNWLTGESQGMGGGDYERGWITEATTWVAPFRRPDSQEVVVSADDWPGVEWPKYSGDQDGQGDMGHFHIGVGGYCAQDLQDPLSGPTGYWCAMAPPRGQCWDKTTNKGSGCTQTHMSPDGVVFPRALNYSTSSLEGAEVHAWRGGGRWFTQRWNVSHLVRENATLIFDPRTGGQGGEGMTTAGQWWVENVLEECDAPDEFYYDAKGGKLYYNFNGTVGAGPPQAAQTWEVPQARQLFSIRGTMAAPVRGVTIRGLVLRDTRLTSLDPHGMPSGGDWALQRSGAVLLEGTEAVTVADSLLTMLDGNGVFLSAYNRNATIANNEASWIGDNAFASWGVTGTCLNANCSRALKYKVGPDGRAGEQPRFTNVTGNLVREIGIYQKQSSFWFQALTAQSLLHGNVHFNGPRAGINFNDGFGGGDVIERNLLANCVRESGDHGPFNSCVPLPPQTHAPLGNRQSLLSSPALCHSAGTASRTSRRSARASRRSCRRGATSGAT